MRDERIPRLSATAATPAQLRGGQVSSVAALSHFVVAVSSSVIAGAAVLILPWHGARRDSRVHREYRGRRGDRRAPAAGRRRTPGDNTGRIETAAAPSRSGSTCRPAHRDRSRGRTAAEGRDGGSGFPAPGSPASRSSEPGLSEPEARFNSTDAQGRPIAVKELH